MKKRILLVLTLLIAFFGFMGLSISNKHVEVYAAGDQNSVNSDLQVVLDNIPKRAILSFPVTYESVYGNEISFTVEENQSAITYDDEAHWMVVNRANADTVTITVTVKGEGGAVATGTKEVTVPEGVTATRSFAITYNYEYENPTELENPKRSYNLGEASFELATPTRYGYKFAGWYENEQYTGEPISKVLVGSMKDYTLYAKWTTMGFDANHVSFADELDYTYDGQAKTPTMNVSNPYGDGNLVLGTDYQVSYDNNINAGTDTATVTVTGIGEYAGSSVTKTFSIAKKELTLTIDSLIKDYGDDDPTYTYSQNGLVNGGSLDMTGFSREEGQDVKVGGYKISYDALKMPNYTITANDDAVLTINPIQLTVNLTSAEPKVYNLGITPTWSLNEFTITGWAYDDTVSVLGGNIVATYYQNGEEAELEAAGTYNVVFSGLTSKNYTFAYGPGQIEVIVADVRFEAKQTYTYANAEQTLEVIAKDKDGNVISDGTIIYENNVHKDAGTYSIKVKFVHNVHGTVESNVDVEIQKAKLSITSLNKEKVYGEKDPLCGDIFIAGGFINEYLINDNHISRTPGENVGTYTITLTIPESVKKNYICADAYTATLTIKQAPLTITANTKSITYGDNNPEKSSYFTVEGLTNKDQFSDEWVSVPNAKNVGSYDVTLTIPEEVAKNYIIGENTETTLTINPKTLTLTINSLEKTYGELDPQWSCTTEGLVGEDSFDKSGFSRVAGEDVGTYAITYTQGNLMPNYTVTTKNSAVLTIKQLDLSDLVTVTYNTIDANTQQGTYAVVPTVMYGETSITTFATTYTYEDEETKLGVATLTITFSGNYTGTYTYNYVVTAKPKALEDGQVIAAAMAQVSTVSNGQTLPTVQYGSSINWISNNTGVTVVDGKVVINEALLNGTTVTLTAYINFEDSADVQSFNVNVETSKQTIYDETTKVTIDNVAGNYNVTIEDVKEEDGSLNYAVEGEELLGAYDITFTEKSSGNEVSNPGKVIVKLPVPEGYNEENYNSLKVYHILDNGSRVEVSFGYQDGYLVFEAASFSPYVIVKPCVHNYESVVTDPTCTEDGYTTHTCSECGHSYVDTQVDALGHNLTEHNTKAATCTEKGHEAYEECTRCDYTTYKEIEALGHDLTTIASKAPTCTEAGHNEYEECSRCDYTTYEEIEANGHDYNEWVVVMEATSTQEGKKERSCKNCEDVEEDTIPKLEIPQTKEITFTLGADGSATHSDGSSKTSYSETVDGYTLSITNATNFYTGAKDAKGNGSIKIGTSSKTGSFNFSVSDDVKSVIIYVAKYKANTSKIEINDTAYALTQSSNDGLYDKIEIDTSITKTIHFESASGGVRCMINSIIYVVNVSGGETEPDQGSTTTHAPIPCDICGKCIVTDCVGDAHEKCGGHPEQKLFNTGDVIMIAVTRTESNYFIATNDLGTASTKRYQAVDSGTKQVDELPNPTDNQKWIIECVDNGYLLKTYVNGVLKYASWTSGNSATLVDNESQAIVFTIKYGSEQGTYNIYFTTNDGERYFSLNNASDSNYFAFYQSEQKRNLTIVKVQSEN